MMQKILKEETEWRQPRFSSQNNTSNTNNSIVNHDNKSRGTSRHNMMATIDPASFYYGGGDGNTAITTTDNTTANKRREKEKLVKLEFHENIRNQMLQREKQNLYRERNVQQLVYKQLTSLKTYPLQKMAMEYYFQLLVNSDNNNNNNDNYKNGESNSIQNSNCLENDNNNNNKQKNINVDILAESLTSTCSISSCSSASSSISSSESSSASSASLTSHNSDVSSYSYYNNEPKRMLRNKSLSPAQSRLQTYYKNLFLQKQQQYYNHKNNHKINNNNNCNTNVVITTTKDHIDNMNGTNQSGDNYEGILWSMEPRIFSIEKSKKGKRKYIVGQLGRILDYYWRKLEPYSRHLYELIPENTPCRLYLDIEFSKLTNNSSLIPTEQLLTDLWDELCYQLRLDYPTVFSTNTNNDNNDDKNNKNTAVLLPRSSCIDLDSSTDTKFSRHWIVHFHNIPNDSSSTTAATSYLFQNNIECGKLVQNLIYRLVDHIVTKTWNDTTTYKPTLVKHLFLNPPPPNNSASSSSQKNEKEEKETKEEDKDEKENPKKSHKDVNNNDNNNKKNDSNDHDNNNKKVTTTLYTIDTNICSNDDEEDDDGVNDSNQNIDYNEKSKDNNNEPIVLANKACIVDLGVYSRNRLFRLMGSSKYGKPPAAALRIADTNQFPFPETFTNSSFYLPAQTTNNNKSHSLHNNKENNNNKENRDNSSSNDNNISNDMSNRSNNSNSNNKGTSIEKQKEGKEEDDFIIKKALQKFAAATDWSLHASALSDTLVVPPQKDQNGITVSFLPEFVEDEATRRKNQIRKQTMKGVGRGKGSQSSHRQQPLSSPTYPSLSCRDWVFGPSPYPMLDHFVHRVLAARKGIQGKIRAWSILTKGQYNAFFDGSNNNNDADTAQQQQPISITYQMLGNRYCENIGRPHKSNNIMWKVDLVTKQCTQYCFDPECIAMRFRGQPVCIPTHTEKQLDDLLFEQALSDIPIDDNNANKANEDNNSSNTVSDTTAANSNDNTVTDTNNTTAKAELVSSSNEDYKSQKENNSRNNNNFGLTVDTDIDDALFEEELIALTLPYDKNGREDNEAEKTAEEECPEKNDDRNCSNDDFILDDNNVDFEQALMSLEI